MKKLRLVFVRFLGIGLLLIHFVTLAQSLPLDSFQWRPISGAITAGVAFPATLTAHAGDGAWLSNLTAAVYLSAEVPGSPPRLVISEIDVAGERIEFTNPGLTPVDLNGWRLDVFAGRNWPQPAATYFFPFGAIAPAGGVFLVNAFGNNPGLYPLLFTQQPFYWGLNQSKDPVAVLVRDPAGFMVDFVCGPNAEPAQIPITGITNAWTGDPLASSGGLGRTCQRVGRMNNQSRLDWVVTNANLGNLNPSLQVPFLAPATILPVEPQQVSLVNGTWTGFLALPVAHEQTTLKADDGNGHVGDSVVLRVLPGPALSLALSENAEESQAGPLAPAVVALPQPSTTNLVVTLLSSDPSEIALPASVLIPAGSTSVVVPLTNYNDHLLDGSQKVTITASAPGFSSATGVITNHDAETASLSLQLPATAREGAGLMPSAGRVSVTNPVAKPVSVFLRASDPIRIRVPESVTIPVGGTSAVFDLVIGLDGMITDPWSIRITAEVRHWTPAEASLIVTNIDNNNLSLSVPLEVVEGQGLLATQGLVRISGTLSTNLIVALTCDKPGKLVLPPEVTIRAGEKSAGFALNVPDDQETDGAQAVVINARAPGFTNGQSVMTVLDNDVHHYQFASLPSVQLVAEPLTVQIHAQSVDDRTILTYGAMGRLSAILFSDQASSQELATGQFTNGTWSPTLVFTSEHLGLRLNISGTAGRSSVSPPLDIVQARILDLAVSDLVYQARTGKILAAASANTNGAGHRLLEIDPATGKTNRSLALGGQPGKIALSDEGTFLYIDVRNTNNVERVDLDKWAIDLQFTTGSNNQGPYIAEDMEVMPGQADTVAISFASSRGFGNVCVAIFDHGVPRPQVALPDSFANSYLIAFGDSADRLYSIFPHGFRRMTVDAQGITLVDQWDYNEFDVSGPAYVAGIYGDMEFDQGLLYRVTGEVIDPRSRLVVGTYPVRGHVIPESARDAVYFLSPQASLWKIEICDQFTFSRQSSLVIPKVQGAAGSFIRWGADGFAFRTTGNQVYLIQTQLVPASSPADLVLNWGPMASPLVVGSNLTISITISNCGPGDVTNAWITGVVPSHTEVLSVVASQGSLGISNQIVTGLIGRLTNHATASVRLVLRPQRPGVWLSYFQVTGASMNRADDSLWITNIVVFSGARPAITIYDDLSVSDLAYDAINHRLYAGVLRHQGAVRNDLEAINLDTGLIDQTIPIPSEPARLVIGRNGQYLYLPSAGNPYQETAIHRVHLPTKTIDLTFPVIDQFGQFHGVLDLAALPDGAEGLLIARYGAQNDVALYVNGLQVKRSPVGLNCRFLALDPSRPNRLYGLTGEMYPVLYRMSIDSGDIKVEAKSGGLFTVRTGRDIGFKAGAQFLYGYNGDVVNPETMQRVAQLAYPEAVQGIALSGPMAINPTNDYIYYLALTSFTPGWVLYAFAPGATVPEWSALVESWDNPIHGSPDSLVMCGSNALAFRTTGDQVIVLDLDRLPRRIKSDLAITETVTPNPAAAEQPVTFTATVVNQGPATARGVMVKPNLPEGIPLIAMTSTSGSCSTQAVGWVCVVNELPAGASFTVTTVVVPRNSGTLRTVVKVSTLDWDPNPTNNTATAATYVIESNADGIRRLDQNSADLVYDVKRQRLYASVPANEPGNANSVLVIDPATGEIGPAIPTGVNPNKLALSDDDQYLYVALDGDSAVQRFRLDTWKAELRFSIGPGLTVQDMAVAPRNPGLVAIARWYSGGSPGHAGVVAYAEGVPLNHSTTVPIFANCIEFSQAADVLYAYGNESSDFLMHVLRVDGNGVTRASSTADLISGFDVDIRFAQNRLYTTSGTVIDPQNLRLIGYFRGAGGLVAPDPGNRRVYFLVPEAPTWKLKAYDSESLVQVGSLAIPGGSGTPSSLLLWGDDGLAFRTSAGQLFLCPRSKVQAVDLAVSQSAITEPLAPGAEVHYQLTLTNRGPGDAHNVVLTSTLPANGALVSATTSFGASVTNQQTVVCRWPILTNGATTILDLVVRLSGPGLAIHRADVTSEDFDPDLRNNSSEMLATVSGTDTNHWLQTLSLPVQDLVYDPVRQRLLALTGSTADRILPLDAQTLAIQLSDLVQLPDTAYQLTLSDEGRFLYAAMNTGGVVRVDLTTQQIDLQFGLGLDDQGYPYRVGDFDVMPRNPEVLAVSMSSSTPGYPHVATYLYDHGQRRTNGIAPGDFDGVYPLRFASPNLLYSILPFKLRYLAIDTNGLTLLKESSNLVPDYNTAFEWDQGLLFFHSGRLVDPVSSTVLGQFPASGLVVPDGAHGRAYMLTQTDVPLKGHQAKLHAFDLTTFGERWSVDLPNGLGRITRMIGLDAFGLALATDAGELVRLQPASFANPSADLALSLMATPNPVTLGAKFTCTLKISNNGPWTATGVVVSNLLPPSTIFTSATTSQGAVTYTNGLLTAQLGDLLNGTTAQVTLMVSFPAEGLVTNQTVVMAQEPDPTPSNNTAIAVVKIQPPPTLTAADVSVREGTGANATVQIAVILSYPCNDPVTVLYSTRDGTAIAGIDYTTNNGRLTIPAGATNRSLIFQIRRDAQIEPDEFFLVAFTNAVNAVLLKNLVRITIINDDAPLLSVIGPTMAEGDQGMTPAEFRVSLNAASAETVQVRYQTVDDTARSGQDYAARSGRLLFAPGETNKILAIPIYGNQRYELEKSFILLLHDPVRAELAITEARARIINDDPEPPLAITDIRWNGPDLAIQFEGIPGRTYQLERSDRLEPNSWTPAGGSTQASQSPQWLTDPQAALRPWAFYRLRWIP